MSSETKDKYGKAEWFDSQYGQTDDDPWGLSWRPSQIFRYQLMAGVLSKMGVDFQNILDIGCATGDFTSLLGVVFPQAQLIGSDFSSTAIERARLKHPKLRFETTSILEVDQRYGTAFDLVTCLEVLYYLDEKTRHEAVEAIKNTLNPGGYVLFSSLRAKPPYFNPEALNALVAEHFKVVTMGSVNIKPLNEAEKLAIKVAKLCEKLNMKWAARLVRSAIRATPMSALSLMNRYLAPLDHLTASHIYIVARKV